LSITILKQYMIKVKYFFYNGFYGRMTIMKTIIIDGYNLLFKMRPELIRSKDRRLVEIERERLIDRLKCFSGDLPARLVSAERACLPCSRHRQAGRQGEPTELVAVFDGTGRSNQRPYPHLRVIFTGAEEEADTFIIEWVKKQPNPKDIMVVSSDTDIRNRLRRVGAQVVSSEEFQQILSPSLPEPPISDAEPPEKFSGIPPEQVTGWLKIFGLEDDD